MSVHQARLRFFKISFCVFAFFVQILFTGCVVKDKSAPLNKPRPTQTEENNSNLELRHPVVSYSGLETATYAAAMLLTGTLIGVYDVKPNSSEGKISGQCFYGSPEQPAFASPCRLLTVELLDQNMTVQTAGTTDRSGRFKFTIPQGQSYIIQVRDTRSRSSKTSQAVKSGTDLVIYIKP